MHQGVIFDPAANHGRSWSYKVSPHKIILREWKRQQAELLIVANSPEARYRDAPCDYAIAQSLDMRSILEGGMTWK